MATPEQIDAFLDAAVDEHTLVVISSDLSHYHPYALAQSIDARTISRIEACESALDGEEACGAHALN
ncbi:AmmeMemoRadiSam system protein B, partial [Enterococcus faecium]|uniref:AmmeMemoRadiSam system protein B n=1 Tax=Enterococcus faecium TaxID=1352 RepID=UPI003F432678